MDVETQMPFQPPLNLFMFVCGIVVGDQMNLPIRRSCHIDQPQKLQPLLVAMPLLAEADYLAGCRIHRGEHRRRPVPFVVVGHGLGPSPFQRQAGLGPVQRLHLAPLVDTKHDSVFGRAELKAHDRLQFLGKMRVIADLEGRGPMRLESMGVPDAEHTRIADPDLLRHAASTPMRGMGWFFERGQSDHFGDFFGGDRGHRSRGASFAKPGRPFKRKRQRQRAAFCTEMERVSAISRFCFPSAASKITRARSATRTSVLRPFAQASRAVRCSAESLTGGATRMKIQQINC